MGQAERMLAPLFQSLPWYQLDGDSHESTDGDDFAESWFMRHLIHEVTPEDDAATAERNARIEEAVSSLTLREAYVIRERFWKQRTLDEIAGDCKPRLSRERVRQIEKEAKQKLAPALKGLPR